MVLDPHWAGNCLYSVGDPSFQAPGESHNQGLASKTRLNGVPVAQRKRVNRVPSARQLDIIETVSSWHAEGIQSISPFSQQSQFLYFQL